MKRTWTRFIYGRIAYPLTDNNPYISIGYSNQGIGGFGVSASVPHCSQAIRSAMTIKDAGNPAALDFAEALRRRASGDGF